MWSRCFLPSSVRGAKRTVNLREVVNGLLYVLSTGCEEAGARRCIEWDYDAGKKIEGKKQ